MRDKRRLPEGQAVSWVIPGDGIRVQALDAADAPTAGSYAATVSEARFLGEITLATLVLDAMPGAPLQLTLAGPERRGLVVRARVAAQLDLELVHVMPVRTGGS